MKIQPLGDRVVLKAISAETTTASGIVLPDTMNKEKPEQAEVVAVGPGKRMEDGSYADMPVKKGDTVLFAKYSPTEVTIDGEEYMIVRADDVLAVVA